ncbi:MAG: ABC transporter ATP-binding protein, partial [Bacteroidetes bacterium]|nr:ABC transporter ATP-binding protein [Bacteroidota bacterium]
IHEQLAALNRNGMTILYTTHYMEEAWELCSRIGIMDGGTIIKLGIPAELLRGSSCNNLEELFLQLTGRQLRDT